MAGILGLDWCGQEEIVEDIIIEEETSNKV